MFLKKIVKEGKLYNFSSKYAASVGQGKGEQWPSILQSFSILFIPLSKISLCCIQSVERCIK